MFKQVVFGGECLEQLKMFVLLLDNFVLLINARHLHFQLSHQLIQVHLYVLLCLVLLI